MHCTVSVRVPVGTVHGNTESTVRATVASSTLRYRYRGTRTVPMSVGTSVAVVVLIIRNVPAWTLFTETQNPRQDTGKSQECMYSSTSFIQ